MLKTTIIKVERGTSSKNGKPYQFAWFTGDKGLPVKEFCPEWVKDGMQVNVYIVPDFRCNAKFEFEEVK